VPADQGNEFFCGRSLLGPQLGLRCELLEGHHARQQPGRFSMQRIKGGGTGPAFPPQPIQRRLEFGSAGHHPGQPGLVRKAFLQHRAEGLQPAEFAAHHRAFEEWRTRTVVALAADSGQGSKLRIHQYGSTQFVGCRGHGPGSPLFGVTCLVYGLKLATEHFRPAVQAKPLGLFLELRCGVVCGQSPPFGR
jgi:hypothetical protein